MPDVEASAVSGGGRRKPAARRCYACRRPDARRWPQQPGGRPGEDNLQFPRLEIELKPFDIEVQRLKSMKHDKGLIEVSIDALVMARKLRDDEAESTCLRIPVDHARTLMLLLKQQFAALDKLQPRSRRSGRA